MQRHPLRAPSVLLPIALAVAAAMPAQVPDGWFVWSSFQGAAGQTGIFFCHPRDPLTPLVAVTGLSANLAYDPARGQGASCVVLRQSDGALLVGERAPMGHSVDLHVLRLNGSDVVHAQLFSMGTSAGQGEIPQCALLPDGRVLVAATDLAGGPLAQYLTQGYNWEGIGLLHPVSGAITPVPIANFAQLPGVINGLTCSPDGAIAYVGNWISSTAGDLWAVPLPGGGTATQVASLPAGVSNLAIDQDGCVLIGTLNGPPNLFRHDPRTMTTTPVFTSSGPLNAVAVEQVTGNWLLATANAGIPVRSLLWMTPGGVEHPLLSPNLATISGVDVHHNPRAFGEATPGVDRYAFDLRGDPLGLPEAGQGFRLRLRAENATPGAALLLLGLQRTVAPLVIEGLRIHVDPAGAVTSVASFGGSLDVPLGIPGNPALRGMRLFAQALLLEASSQTLAASAGVQITVL